MPDQAVTVDGRTRNEPVSDPPRIREAPVPTTTVRSGPLPTGNIETPIHAPVPLIYGRSAVKAQVFGRSESNWSINNQEQVWFGLCLGPIDSVEWWYDGSMELRASDFDTGNRGGYTGAPTVDAGALSKTPFPGTVLGTMAKNDNGYNRSPLNPGAMVKGRTVYDPRLDTAPGAHPTTSTYIAWSENPALCMADLKTSARYGSAVPPADIDWPSVVAAADHCEEQVDGLTRYTLNICLGASKTVSDWEKTLGLHFGACWQFMGTRWSLIVYKAATASPISIVPGDIVGSPKLARNSSGLQAPNRITVEWADLWGQSHQVSVQTTAVDAGAAVIDPGTYALHGCTTRVQALRCAQAILDQALYDMTLDVELMPAMLDLTIGDLIELNDPSVAPLGTRFQIVSAGRTDTDTVQVRAQEYVGPPGSESAPFTPGDLTIYAGPPYTTGYSETYRKTLDPAGYADHTDSFFTFEYKCSTAAEEANAVAIRFRAGAGGGTETFSALPSATEVRIPTTGNLAVEHATYYKAWIPFITAVDDHSYSPATGGGWNETINGCNTTGRIVMVVEGKNGSVSSDQVVMNVTELAPHSSVSNSIAGRIDVIDLYVQTSLHMDTAGSKIKGKFSGSLTDRVYFEGADGDAFTVLSLKSPATTGATSYLNLCALNDTSNSPIMSIWGGSNECGFQTTATGTATAKPFRWFAGGTQVAELTTAGAVNLTGEISFSAGGMVGPGRGPGGGNMTLAGQSATGSWLRIGCVSGGAITFFPDGTAQTADSPKVSISATSMQTSIPLGVNGGVGVYMLVCNGQPAANGYTAWTNYSDRRLKKRIAKVAKSSLDKIALLEPVTFSYNDRTKFDRAAQDRTIHGFVAQEIQKVFPEMVGESEIDGVKYLDTNLSDLPVHLVHAVQELLARVRVLEARP